MSVLASALRPGTLLADPRGERLWRPSRVEVTLLDLDTGAAKAYEVFDNTRWALEAVVGPTSLTPPTKPRRRQA